MFYRLLILNKKIIEEQLFADHGQDLYDFYKHKKDDSSAKIIKQLHENISWQFKDRTSKDDCFEASYRKGDKTYILSKFI